MSNTPSKIGNEAIYVALKAEDENCETLNQLNMRINLLYPE